MGKPSLSEIFDRKPLVVTAHRGFSGRFPENTLLAFQEAVRTGADIIEFDIRSTKDFVPVLLHDETLDRTSDGTGKPESYTLEEIKKFNFSFWQGAHSDGRRLTSPAFPDIGIPAFEELLESLAGRICMNIQLYDTREPLLGRICGLYRKYGLYESAYLTVGTYQEAERILGIDAKAQICVLDSQGSMTEETLKSLKAFGCKYIQPFRNDVNPEFCERVKELSLCASMFFSDTEEDNKKFISMGIQGILTNYPDVLLRQK